MFDLCDLELLQSESDLLRTKISVKNKGGKIISIKESTCFITKELYLPQPSQNFCQICRSEFENYHQHLISRFHLNFMRKSKGNKWIGEACRSLLKGSRQKKKKNSERPLYSE